MWGNMHKGYVTTWEEIWYTVDGTPTLTLSRETCTKGLLQHLVGSCVGLCSLYTVYEVYEDCYTISLISCAVSLDHRSKYCYHTSSEVRSPSAS
jgi:hypothetical protein